MSKIIRNYLLVLSLLALLSNAHAQNLQLKNHRTASLTLDSSQLMLDTLTIIPSSVVISLYSDTIPSSSYSIQNNKILFDQNFYDIHSNKQIHVLYRVFQEDFEAVYKSIDSAIMQSPEDRAIYIGHDYEPYKDAQRERLFESENLDYNGSFTRGFSLGNSQSLVLNSNFNLQMSGDLGNDMNIQAAISDDNLPIQADGNTQLLQEFDKVYMKVNKGKTSIIAGDYESARPNSYFMNYFKKLKGLSISNHAETSGEMLIKSRGNFAIARGKFSRYTLVVQEGNQGPYRLVGNEGEQLLKVLSGTEKVYLDGNILKRGLDFDYVIAYDRAEVVFTPNILITKDSRIIVEFEYADQNYLRTQYGAGVDLIGNRYEMSLNIYTEQDSRTASGDIDLDSLDVIQLQNVGDDLDNAVSTGIRPYIESGNEFVPLLYKHVYEESIQDSILLYCPDVDSARYTVSFSDVGFGNGNYAIDTQAAANGRAYKWVGNNAGQYEPIIKLVAPEKKQLVTLGGNYKLSEGAMFSGEMALSNLDRNRFSNVNNEDNNGLAGTFNLSNISYIGSKEKGLKFLSEGGIEIVNKNFNPLNPYRSAEYNRDWNITNAERSSEVLSKIKLGITKENVSSINYTFQNFRRSTIYKGSKNVVDFNLNNNGWNIIGEANYLSSEDNFEKTNFTRPKIDISKSLKFLDNWRVGLYYEGESNKRTEKSSSFYANNSRQYRYIKTYVESSSYENFKLRVGFNQRKDFLPVDNSFEQSTIAKEFQLSGQWLQGSNSQLIGNFIIRNLEVTGPALPNITDKNTYLGRLDYNLNAFNGAIKSNTSYQVGSGQQSKVEFEYVMVQKGEGQYIWLDDGDGVEETFEFQISPVQDTANYIKIAVYNNEFIRTNNNSINQNFRLSGRHFFDGQPTTAGTGQKLLSKISLLLNYRLSQKSEEDGSTSSFSPFKFNLQDTNLISFNSAINNTLFFNQGSPVYDIQIGNRKNINKFVLVSGAEQNEISENFTRIRWGVNRATDFLFNLSQGNRKKLYEFFDDNGYSFDFVKINPEFNYRPKGNLRLILDYIYQNKKSIDDDVAKSHELAAEFTWRRATKSNLTTNLSFIHVKYDGQKNNNLELAILDGLKKGQNYLWGINYTKRMAKNIDLIVSYDGRKTGSSRTIHTGRAQVKATF